METTTTAPAHPDTLRITVADLTLRADDRVATYKHGTRTFTVLALSHGFTVPELVESVKRGGFDKNLDPWIAKTAYNSGIRLDF